MNKTEDINDIIIGGGMNQDIASSELQEFFTKLRVKDIHQQFNFIKVEDMDRMHKHSSKYIDSIVVMLNVLQCIEGS